MSTLGGGGCTGWLCAKGGGGVLAELWGRAGAGHPVELEQQGGCTVSSAMCDCSFLGCRLLSC